MGLEVGDINVVGEVGIDEVFYGGLGFLDGGFVGVNFIVFVVLVGRVVDGGVDIFKGDGEVNEVEVEVVDVLVGELFFDDGLDVFIVVEGVLEFGDDEEVFMFYNIF